MKQRNSVKKTEIKVEVIALAATNSLGLGSPEPLCHRFDLIFLRDQVMFFGTKKVAEEWHEHFIWVRYSDYCL